MTGDDQYRAHDLLRRLIAWKNDLLELNQLWADVCLLCGARNVVDLPDAPAILREKLIDVVEEYLERHETEDAPYRRCGGT